MKMWLRVFLACALSVAAVPGRAAELGVDMAETTLKWVVEGDATSAVGGDKFPASRMLEMIDRHFGEFKTSTLSAKVTAVRQALSKIDFSQTTTGDDKEIKRRVEATHAITTLKSEIDRLVSAENFHTTVPNAVFATNLEIAYQGFLYLTPHSPLSGIRLRPGSVTKADYEAARVRKFVDLGVTALITLAGYFEQRYEDRGGNDCVRAGIGDPVLSEGDSGIDYAKGIDVIFLAGAAQKYRSAPDPRKGIWRDFPPAEVPPPWSIKLDKPVSYVEFCRPKGALGIWVVTAGDRRLGIKDRDITISRTPHHGYYESRDPFPDFFKRKHAMSVRGDDGVLWASRPVDGDPKVYLGDFRTAYAVLSMRSTADLQTAFVPWKTLAQGNRKLNIRPTGDVGRQMRRALFALGVPDEPCPPRGKGRRLLVPGLYDQHGCRP
jgi:hypothetical protein